MKEADGENKYAATREGDYQLNRKRDVWRRKQRSELPTLQQTDPSIRIVLDKLRAVGRGADERRKLLIRAGNDCAICHRCNVYQ